MTQKEECLTAGFSVPGTTDGWMDAYSGPKLEAVMRVLPGWLGCVGEEPTLAAPDGMVELCYKFLALLVLPFHQQHGGV